MLRGDAGHLDGGLTAPHKAAWPLSGVEIGAFFLTLVGLVLAAAGGIGGGGFIVPIYVMMLDFSASQAVALSNVTILGGSLANFVFNVGKMRVNGETLKPLIDWNLLLIMEPTTIAGAILGTYLTCLIPDVILSCLLCIVLAAIGVNMGERALGRWRSETRAAGEAVAAEAEGNGEAEAEKVISCNMFLSCSS